VDRERPLRMTRQRRLILEELGKVTTHPTAPELYNLVRRRLNRVSLGTIYRNLQLLADRGMIQRIETGGVRRFDGNVEQHYHIRCERCGCLGDVHVGPSLVDEKTAAAVTDFDVRGHHLEFLGLCPECAKKESA
jgi:Fur family ferric uptake transcriptional regulator